MVPALSPDNKKGAAAHFLVCSSPSDFDYGQMKKLLFYLPHLFKKFTHRTMKHFITGGLVGNNDLHFILG